MKRSRLKRRKVKQVGLIGSVLEPIGYEITHVANSKRYGV